MIQVDPSKRPTCIEILAMPYVRSMMEKLGFIVDAQDPSIPVARPFRASDIHQILTPYNTNVLPSRLPQP